MPISNISWELYAWSKHELAQTRDRKQSNCLYLEGSLKTTNNILLTSSSVCFHSSISCFRWRTGVWRPRQPVLENRTFVSRSSPEAVIVWTLEGSVCLLMSLSCSLWSRFCLRLRAGVTGEGGGERERGLLFDPEAPSEVPARGLLRIKRNEYKTLIS